jgi:uncharacterized membrane protein
VRKEKSVKILFYWKSFVFISKETNKKHQLVGGKRNKKKANRSYLEKQNIKIEMKWGKKRKMVETKHKTNNSKGDSRKTKKKQLEGAQKYTIVLCY